MQLVKVRDSFENPFLAQAAGTLKIQGNRAIDILALNHPSHIPFVSGGNLISIGDGIISLDARFASGGSFSIQNASGGLANFVSLYDPIISSNGDVDVAANYTGASLLVEAKGNIRFRGNINITKPDTSGLPAGLDSATLSKNSALILRSGQSTLAYGGNNSGLVPAYSTGTIPAGITLNGSVILQPFNSVGGTVNLSAASGNVSTQLISTNGRQITDFQKDAQGGAITIEASLGSISTGDLSSDSFSNFGSARDGGAISLNAFGSISTGDLVSRSMSESGNAGQGGAISLEANNGGIEAGAVLSNSSSTFGSARNGGAISLNANGSITTNNLYSDSRAISGNAGQGGAISLNAFGNISTEMLISSSYSPDGFAAQGGAISLIATNGSIFTADLFSDSSSRFGSAGQGGTISLTTKNGNISTANLNSSSSSIFGNAGQGGAINFNANNGSISTNNLYSYSRSESGGGGTGGAISLRATDRIVLFKKVNYSTIGLGPIETNSFGFVNSTGSLGSGDITIVSNAPFTLYNGVTNTDVLGEVSSNNGIISSDTFGSGKAGDIQITAPSISLSDGAQISASTHSSGQGGNITLRASDKVELRGATINGPEYLYAPSGLAGIAPGEFFGGFIPIGNATFTRDDPPPSGSLYPSGLFTQTTIGSTGGAGNLKIETGQLSIESGAAIATTTFGQGSNAGNISIDATKSILVANGSILSGVAGSSSGNSGNIDLQTPTLSVTKGGIVQTQTLGQGDAGAIRVSASDSVNLSGAGSALRSASGGSNTLLGTASNNIGQGGNISITTNNLNVADGAVLDARTQTPSKGGNITVDANTLSAVNSGQLLTTTSSDGLAGDIAVNATELQLSGSSSGIFAQTSSSARAGNLTIQPLGNGQTLTINFQDGAQISASTQGSGNGGTLRVNAPSSVNVSGNGILSALTSGEGTAGKLTFATGQLTVQNGATAAVSSTGSGLAGDLSVTAKQLRVQNGAEVTVSSQRTGDAGNLDVNANSVVLDNNGKLRATSTLGKGGGNIKLLDLDLLLLRGNSEISTTAGGVGNSGNINIDTDLLAAIENSKIAANAFEGQGGNITINTQGLFLSPGSTVTASSERGINGLVEINRPDIDPSTDLVTLPAQIVDVRGLVASGCSAGGNLGRVGSEFVVSGRGGVPPTPAEATRSDTALVDLGQPVQGEENRPRARIPSNLTTAHSAPPLVEASGWTVSNKGKVILTAAPTTATSDIPWLTRTSCSGS